MTNQLESPTIRIEKGGPCQAESSMPVHNAKSEVVGRQRRRFLLCRCGGSGNKPYHNGKHWSNGFQAAGDAREA